jgi:hypothetical protein
VVRGAGAGYKEIGRLSEATYALRTALEGPCSGRASEGCGGIWNSQKYGERPRPQPLLTQRQEKAVPLDERYWALL